jgi:hypothetical protein
VYPDEEHHDWCDVARCLVTGLQRSGCPGRHDCGRDLWSGLWPGEAECAEYGFLYGAGFPDLNRLYLEAHWDPGLRRWVRDPGPRPDGAAG